MTFGHFWRLLNTKWHFLRQMVLTQTPRGTKAKVCSNVTGQMKWRRNEGITNAFCKLKMESFISLVLSINVAMGKEGKKFYFRISEKLAEKRSDPYSVMRSWARRKMSFSSMKSIITWICGSQSIRHERENHNFEELASYSEARCNIDKTKVLNNITIKKC